MHNVILTGITKTCPGGPGNPLEPGIPSLPGKPWKKSNSSITINCNEYSYLLQLFNFAKYARFYLVSFWSNWSRRSWKSCWTWNTLKCGSNQWFSTRIFLFLCLTGTIGLNTRFHSPILLNFNFFFNIFYNGL